MKLDKTNAFYYFPIIGLVVYVIIFTLAANKYYGGSLNHPDQMAYSFFDNFLCDIMNPITPSDNVNGSRPLAILAHLILSFTMISFFFILPKIFPIANRNTRLIRYFGMATMTIFILMFTENHDIIVTFTGIFGTMALIPFFIELRRYPIAGYKQLAYLCFVLSIIVFLMYESKFGIYFLPFIQKITFLFDAWWVIWTCLIVIKKIKSVPALH